MATPNQKPTNDGWTLVTRRRRPSHFLPSPHSPPRRTSPLNLRPPTYAQVVRSGPNSPPLNSAQMTTQDKPTKRSHSPQSPTNLRYPPNPHFREWWGRCFRCAKKGHVVAECPLPRSQPKTDAHINLADHHDPTWLGSIALTGPQTSSLREPEPKRARAEPSFEEFLAQPEPHEEPYMPSIRPAKTVCYINMDEEYFRTFQKLSSAIIVQPPDNTRGEFSLDQVADIIAATNKLKTTQLQVGRLARDRFLVVLPPEVNRDEIVAAIPRKVWDDGFLLQPYSPVIDASISIPFFKIWVDIRGVPLELYTETHMARVISSFGIYLGSLEPQITGDCQTWSVFLATDDLALVPHQVEVRVGGMVYTAQVCPRKWMKGQVFHRSELPPSSIPYRPPSSSVAPVHREEPTPPVDPRWFQQDEDIIPMSLTALREIFRKFASDELPADFAACLAGDERAIAANHEAYRQWEANEERRRHREQNQAVQEPIPIATHDPLRVALGPTTMQQPTQELAMSRSLDCQITTAATTPTVHRTDQGAPRGKRVLTDLALQVCTLHSSQSQVHNLRGWEPSDLFPEICMSQTIGVSPSRSRDKKQKTRTPTPNKPAKPRRSTRIKINKKKNGDEGTIGLEVNDFIDIPLQHAEGTELLAAIGAGNMSIPPYLMLSLQQQQPRLEIGQASKGPSKRKKQTGPQLDPVPQTTQAHEVSLEDTQSNHYGPMHEEVAHNKDGAEAPLEQNGDPPLDMTILETSASQMNFGQPIISDEQEEDQYLDQVDYSDEDLLP